MPGLQTDATMNLEDQGSGCGAPAISWHKLFAAAVMSMGVDWDCERGLGPSNGCQPVPVVIRSNGCQPVPVAILYRIIRSFM